MSEQGKEQGPTRFGGFELLATISEGSSGVVCKARQLSLNRIVALKIVPYELADDARFVAHFESEARAAAQLKHPNLVEVYDAGEVDGNHYIVLEYVEGETVADKVWRDGPMDERQAAGICHDIAQALRYAADRGGWVHGDLKPSNVLLERGSNRARLSELGLGKSKFGHGEGSSQPSASYSMATPWYVSPERAAGLVDFDSRADMYSLGATLYQMLTGRIPFEGLSPEEAIEQHQHGHLPDPRTIRPELSDSVATVLERMLARDPGNRYPNWSVLAHDLARIRDGQGPVVPRLPDGLSTLQHSTSQTPKAQSKSKAPLVRIAATAIALIVVTIGVCWYFLMRPTHEPPATQGAAETNAPSAPTLTAEPPPPSAEEAAAAARTRAEEEKAAREAEARRLEEEEKATKLAAQAAREAEAKGRYDAWRPSFETLLTNREFDRAVEAVAKAQSDPQFETVKAKLDGDEGLARSLVRVRETAWQNFPGQKYTLGTASGVVTRVEPDKLWVKLSAGEIAVPKTSVDAAKLCAAALSRSPNDPQLTLAAGMFAWYHGDEKLARTHLTAAVKAGAKPGYPLPLDVAVLPSPSSPFADGRPTPTPTPTPRAETSETPENAPAAENAGAGSPKSSAQIDMVVKKGLKRGFSGTDYDNQRDAMSFSVSIKNKEFRIDYTKLTAILYVYGRSTTTQQFQMLLKKQSKEFDLLHGATHEFEGGTLNLEYDENYTAKFGVKYAGYVLVIRDSSGSVVKAKSTNQSFVQHVEKFDLIKEGSYFESNLRGLDGGN